MIKQITIFGVGLIGGSLAMALNKAGFCEKIIGCSRNREHLQQAVELGVIDQFTTDPRLAVENADLIFLSVPLGAMASILAQIKDYIPEHAIITDGGSAKMSVKQAAEQAFDGKLPSTFVLGHPIAGREKSGVGAAVVDLYQDRKVILTPVADTNPEALATVTKMWQTAGAIVETLNVEEHDLTLAATSHLPHVLAYELVSTLAQSDVSADIFRYAAGGFQDFTRIASSDPVMWRDICLENRDAILTMLDEFTDNLQVLRKDIAESNAEAIYEEFSLAKDARDQAMKPS